jgi:plasmid maintenance system antidote protein VapI
MVKLTVSRKARFESALKLVGLTQTSWAEASGVPKTHLNEFLNGKRVSAPLAEKIDRFIAKVEAAEIIPLERVG